MSYHPYCGLIGRQLNSFFSPIVPGFPWLIFQLIIGISLSQFRTKGVVIEFTEAWDAKNGLCLRGICLLGSACSLLSDFNYCDVQSRPEKIYIKKKISRRPQPPWGSCNACSRSYALAYLVTQYTSILEIPHLPI